MTLRSAALMLLASSCNLPAHAAQRLDEAHPADPRTVHIRRRCQTIDANLKHYTLTRRDIMDRTSEGGSLQAYFARGGPRKVTVQLFWGQGQTLSSYYFHNNRLIFVDSVKRTYLTMEEFNENSPRVKNRFYFKNGQLIRWIDDAGKAVAGRDSFARQQRLILHGANEWLTMAKAQLRKQR